MNIVNALLRKLETKDIHPHTLALAQVMEAFKANTEAQLHEQTQRIEALERKVASVSHLRRDAGE